MEKVVLNIPHSSLVIPKWATCDMIISPDELSLLAQFMVDKDVDQLWEFVPEANKQVATVSRLVVDAERYRCDNEEPMASLGMGLYYTHTPEGKCFRIKSEGAYRKCLEIYDEYHGAFEKKVSDCLQANGSCIILDCHSFHDAMEYTGFCSEDFPDVCIGVNGIITEEARYVSEVFRQFGYSVEINRPFSGALVPLRFLEDVRVTSIMIELNRRIYDNAAFGAVQNLCRQIYRCLCERRKNGINGNRTAFIQAAKGGRSGEKSRTLCNHCNRHRGSANRNDGIPDGSIGRKTQVFSVTDAEVIAKAKSLNHEMDWM